MHLNIQLKFYRKNPTFRIFQFKCTSNSGLYKSFSFHNEAFSPGDGSVVEFEPHMLIKKGVFWGGGG